MLIFVVIISCVAIQHYFLDNNCVTYLTISMSISFVGQKQMIQKVLPISTITESEYAGTL